MSTLAFPLLTLAISHSPVLAGLTGTTTLAARLLFRLPAGALVDQSRRDRVLLVFNIVGFIAAISIGLAYAFHRLVIFHVFLACGVIGAADAFLLPALSAAVRTLVTPERRPAALAMSQARSHGASVVGPPLGGALYGVNASLPFLGDALSYAVAFISAIALRGKLPAPEIAKEPMRTSITKGLRYVWRDPTVRGLMVWGAIVNLAGSTVWTAVILRLTSTGSSAGEIGTVEAAAAIAGLVGSIFAPRLVTRTRTGRMTVVTGLIVSVMFALSALLSSAVWVGVCLAAATLFLPANNSGIGAYIAARVPDEMQGRFNSAAGFVAQGLQPLGPLFAGVVAQSLGAGWPMVLAGAIALASLAPVAAVKELRALGRPDSWRTTPEA